MNNEQIIPSLGCFTLGFFLGVILIVSILLPSYTSTIDEAHYASEVIDECIDHYPDFYDTIGEGDNWANYTSYKH